MLNVPEIPPSVPGARHYAGGVLKIEPGAAMRLPVVRCEEPNVLDQLDTLLRDGRQDVARHLADEAVLQRTLGFSAAQCQTLNHLAEELAQRRKPPIRRQT